VKRKHPFHQQCSPGFPTDKLERVHIQLLKQALVFLTENITQCLQKSLVFNILIIETSVNEREKARKGGREGVVNEARRK